MSDFYNMKEEVKEIVKTHGGKEFFSELNAARVPFFFTAATENTAEKTEYLWGSALQKTSLLTF